MASSVLTSFADLSELPGHYAALASDFRAAALQIADLSLPKSESGLFSSSTYLLRTGKVTTRFFIARQKGRTVFFFVRQASPVRVVLDASIGFRLAIEDTAADELPPITLGSIHNSVILPRFFRAAPDVARLSQIQTLLHSPLAEILILSLDTGLMAIAHPDSVQNVGIVWQVHGQFESVVDPSAKGRTFHIPPFLAIARSIKGWVKEGFEVGDEMEFALDDSSKAPRIVLRQLATAWVEAVNHLQSRGTSPAELDDTAPTYGLSGYKARVVLRLTPDGDIADKDGDDPFQLLATMSIAEEKGVVRSRIAIGPPDFLVAGTLHDAFLDALLLDEAVTRLTKELGLGPEAVPDVAAWLRSGWKEGALVFRVKRGRDISQGADRETPREMADKSKDRDTEMVVLQGAFRDMRPHLVLKFDCRVDTSADPPIHLFAETIRVLYTMPVVGKEPADEGKLDLVRYFLRLLTHLRDWFGVLK